jgi:V8-like Glu-specific endopeptidase
MIARLAITAIAVALLAGGAAADTVSESVRNSIARLNYAGHGTRYHCTATVVAPNAAMTTKSCIASVDPTSIHLVSGFDRGTWTEHRRVTRAVFDSSDNDVALLCTDATFEVAGAFSDVPDGEGGDMPDSLLVAGYWAPRHQTLNVRSCGISERRAPDGSMILDCGVPAGGGGAPAFTETDGTVRLHGIAIAGPADTTRIARWRGDAPEQACTFP